MKKRFALALLVALSGHGLAAAQSAAPSSAATASPVLPTDTRCARAAVLVTVDGGTGSGTMIDARGFVLTNHHVVAPVLVPGFDGPSVRAGAHLRVQVPGAQSLEATDVYEAEIVAADADLDLALVRITGRVGEASRNDLRFDALAIALGEALPIGSRIGVLGYPFGHRILTVLTGTITGRREQTDGTVEWMTTDAPFNPGNSGGSVVDDQCRLVGIPTQVYRGGLNPVSMARPVDARLRAYVETAVREAARRTNGASTPSNAFGPPRGEHGVKPDAVQPRRRRASGRSR